MKRILISFTLVAIVSSLASCKTGADDKRATKGETLLASLAVGDSKEDVLDKCGVPEKRFINKNGQLIYVSVDSDPVRSCRELQPSDEIWVWGYKKFVLRIENGKVANITKIGDSGNDKKN
jgi:hypothetical protein